jgi:hypothetical protein
MARPSHAGRLHQRLLVCTGACRGGQGRRRPTPATVRSRPCQGVTHSGRNGRRNTRQRSSPRPAPLHRAPPATVGPAKLPTAVAEEGTAAPGEAATRNPSNSTRLPPAVAPAGSVSAPPPQQTGSARSNGRVVHRWRGAPPIQRRCASGHTTARLAPRGGWRQSRPSPRTQPHSWGSRRRTLPTTATR